MQCPSCGMAWFLGEAPEEGEDAEEECSRCASEHVALSRARAEALEEVCRGLVSQSRQASSEDESDLLDAVHDWVYGLIGTTPPASISVERVREVIGRMAVRGPYEAETDPAYRVRFHTAQELARRLGVPLDGEQEAPAFCPMCNHEIFNHSKQYGGCVVTSNDPETGDRCACVVTP